MRYSDLGEQKANRNAAPFTFLFSQYPPRFCACPLHGTLPTGIPEIDELTGGGIPRATMTEVYGSTSSGRISLMFSLLRQATQQGECCALVDVQDTFDPQSAAAVGIQLAYVLWVRCGGNVEHALKAADLLIRAGGFGVVIMDLPAHLTGSAVVSRSPPGFACDMEPGRAEPP